MKNNRMHLAHDCNMKPFLFGFEATSIALSRKIPSTLERVSKSVESSVISCVSSKETSS